MPKHIRITVLLIPGIIIPQDITNPHKNKNKKLFSVIKKEVSKFFSKKIRNNPKQKLIKVYNKSENLNFFSLFACLNKEGIPPKINPKNNDLNSI